MLVRSRVLVFSLQLVCMFADMVLAKLADIECIRPSEHSDYYKSATTKDETSFYCGSNTRCSAMKPISSTARLVVESLESAPNVASNYMHYRALETDSPYTDISINRGILEEAVENLCFPPLLTSLPTSVVTPQHETETHQTSIQSAITALEGIQSDTEPLSPTAYPVASSNSESTNSELGSMEMKFMHIPSSVLVHGPTIQSQPQFLLSSTAAESALLLTSSPSPISSTITQIPPVKAGKRGLAYNDASLTTCFSDATRVTWAYNWASTSNGLSSSFKFIPMLWGTTDALTASWITNANASIVAGSTHLMSFNEPDMVAQSNLSPEAAAAAYRTWMMPFAGRSVKLGAPSVTNGDGMLGLNWLNSFMHLCSDCQIDFINIHWYAPCTQVDDFMSHVQNATNLFSGKSIIVSEFGCTDGTSEEISSFLRTALPWMDAQSYIEGYAYFMVSEGNLVDGTKPSSYGRTYAFFDD